MPNDQTPEQLVASARRAPGTVAVRPAVIVLIVASVFVLLGLMLVLVTGRMGAVVAGTLGAGPTPAPGFVTSPHAADVADLGYATPKPTLRRDVEPTPIPDVTLNPTLLAGNPITPAPAPPDAPSDAPPNAAPPPAALAAAPAEPPVNPPTESPAERRARSAANAAQAAAQSKLEVTLPGASANAPSREETHGNGHGDRARHNGHSDDPDDYDIAPGSDYVLQRGQLIPVTLYSSIDSTVGGLIIGYASEDVWDALHRAVVVPRGAKLIGTFGRGATQGQRRLAVVWDSIKLPNGHTIVLDNMPGIDLTGTSGFGAAVDNHSRQLFRNVVLLSILSAGAQLAQPGNGSCNSGGYSGCTPSLGQSVAQSVGSQIANAGTQVFTRDANLEPTLHVVEGAQVGVMVEHDLPLHAWRLQ